MKWEEVCELKELQDLPFKNKTGAYQFIEGEYGQYIEKDYEKEESIRLKYNPDARGTYYDVVLGETFYLPGY